MSEAFMNFRTLTLLQLRQILGDTGYITEDKEFKFADDNDHFKYIGCVDGSARYLVAFIDEEESDGDQYYVTTIFVSIEHDKLTASYAGCPCFQTYDIDSVGDYIETRCN